VVALAWVFGAIPFSNLMAKRTRGVDLRTVGTGTVSGTGLYKVAGFGPLAVAGVCEIAKASVGPALAGRRRPYLAAAAGGASVIGHNWSPFLSGAGGRGISPAIGACLPQQPEGAAVLLGGLVVGKALHETALGSLIADALLVPVLGWRRGRTGAVMAVALITPIVVKRLAGNGPAASEDGRVYLWRLLFDRDSRLP
jgi:glycerol-3-phosphate acyltransferase PlsY